MRRSKGCWKMAIHLTILTRSWKKQRRRTSGSRRPLKRRPIG